MKENHPQHLVWCLGMYASGSTWLFNAARAVATLLHPGQRVTGHYAEHMRQLRTLPKTFNVVKTHALGAQAEAYLASHASSILISLRDPRDAVTSMMQYMGLSFAQALQQVSTSGQFAARFAGDARTTIFIYEAGFTEAEAAFDALAAAMGGALTTEQRATLYAATRRSKIEEKISRLENLPTVWRHPDDDMLDRDTQWHSHHAGRSGEIGRWRRALSNPEVALIEQNLADLMRIFDYRPENP